MLMLLSPAKTLTEGPALDAFPATAPALHDEVRILQNTLRARKAKELRELMGISENLATLNYERHQQLSPEPSAEQARQAIFLFAGDVYRGLDAPSLDADAITWAQDHVGILSGLYGVLRPLDLTQPYRLEMGTSLKTRRGKNLYDYWGDRIAKQLAQWADDAGHSHIVNLASNEYFSAVDTKKLGRPVITPIFKDIKDGKARTLGFFAKQARGAMVRWAAEHRPDSVEALKQCDAMGYAFDPSASTKTKWVFSRQQPPPVNG